MKSVDLLSQDHKVILRSLDILENIAARVQKGEKTNRDDVQSILDFLRVFEDEYHQTKEETALFPELMRCAESEQTNLRQMLFEHDQERSLVDGLEEALKTNQATDFVLYAYRLSTILRGHIYKEDHLLFSIIETSISKEQDERIVAEFEAFDRSLGIDKKRLLLASLASLESKYLRKTA